MKNQKSMKKKNIILIVMLVFCIYPLAAEPCGDVNSNEEIDIIDALWIARYYVGFDPELL